MTTNKVEIKYKTANEKDGIITIGYSMTEYFDDVEGSTTNHEIIFDVRESTHDDIKSFMMSLNDLNTYSDG